MALRRRSRRAGAVPWSGLLLGLAALGAGLSAALLWRARAEPVPPPLEGADALVAEAAALLEAGDADAAARRYGEALSADPERADALLGRARARARAGAEPALVRDDLERALALDPKDVATLRTQGEVRLARGDLRGAREALDRALEAAGGSPARAAAEVDAIADVRLLLDEAARAQEAALDGARTLLAALDGRAALAALESALATAPGSARLLAGLSAMQADLGEFDAALRSASEAERLDPALALDPQEADRLRVRAHEAAAGQGGAPDPTRWCPTRGGVWREAQGVITAQGSGLGEFELAGLLWAEPASAEATLSVEVSLTSGDPGPYAGLIVGGRDRDDLFLVYVFHDPSLARRTIDPAALAEHRRRTGAWPKFVRVARLQEGRWQHRATQAVEFPDTGWVSLEVELRGQDLTPIVAGRRGEPVHLERRLDGRVGLLKFYDTVARWRGFMVEGR